MSVTARDHSKDDCIHNTASPDGLTVTHTHVGLSELYVKVEVEGKHSYAFHSPDQGVTVKFIRFQIEAKTRWGGTKHPHPTIHRTTHHG